MGLTGGAFNKNERIVNSGFDTIEKVLELTHDQLIGVEGFAKKSANDYLSSLGKKKSLVNNLLSHGFNLSVNNSDVDEGSSMFGKKSA